MKCQVLSAECREAPVRTGASFVQPGQGEDSGVTGVLIRNGKVDGAADPRREGVVLVLQR